jgi:acetyl-CoA carboxylase biotin carboxyl carrier protein
MAEMISTDQSVDQCVSGGTMEKVQAEMAANVWKVLVTEGQPVEADETLVILESMKMEIPVPAPVSGRVATLAVAEGAAVLEGDLIAEIG